MDIHVNNYVQINLLGYFQIFLAKDNVPADSYNFFIDILLDTIRGEIAACMEKAYDKVTLNEAARMLHLSSLPAIKEYGEKVCNITYQHCAMNTQLLVSVLIVKAP